MGAEDNLAAASRMIDRVRNPIRCPGCNAGDELLLIEEVVYATPIYFKLPTKEAEVEDKNAEAISRMSYRLQCSICGKEFPFPEGWSVRSLGYDLYPYQNRKEDVDPPTPNPEDKDLPF